MSYNNNNTCLPAKLTVIPPISNKQDVVLKADSGASKTYIRPHDQRVLANKEMVKHKKEVTIPNSTNMTTIEKGDLPLHPLLLKKAQTGNVLRGLNNASLLSLGQLCDDDCIAVLDKRFLNVYKYNHHILQGCRNWTDGLWDVHIKKQQETLNVIVRKNQTKHELAEYLHKCAFSPSLSTFQRAIRKGHLITWPGITNINFEKHITNLVPVAKGHLDQERANLQSTKENPNDTEDFEPTDGMAKKTWENAAILYAFNPKEKTYSDQTGRFPHQSSRGNEYVMVIR